MSNLDVGRLIGSIQPNGQLSPALTRPDDHCAEEQLRLDACREVAALLATAYRRRSAIQHVETEATCDGAEVDSRSAGASLTGAQKDIDMALANTPPESVHGVVE